MLRFHPSHPIKGANPMNTFQYFRFEEADGVVTLTIDRPQDENFLDGDVLREMAHVFDAIDALHPRALILTGAGDKAFFGGVDPKYLYAMGGTEGQAASALGQEICMRLERAPYVTIAAVNGQAFGGGLEITLACDLALASPSALFSQIEGMVGLVPGFGGTFRLQRRVGIQRARWLTYSASFFGAEEAKAFGVVLEVVPSAMLLSRAREMAAACAKSSAAAVADAKALITLGSEAPLSAHQEAERRAFGRLLDTTETKSRFAGLISERAKSSGKSK
jgi:enoyl-CoA hydratase